MPEPFPESLCHRCRWVRLVPGKHSTFLGCTEVTMPKYVPQPVRHCPKFEAEE